MNLLISFAKIASHFCTARFSYIYVCLSAAIADRSSYAPSLFFWGGDFFVSIVAQRHSNNLGRSSNSKNLDLKKFPCVTNQFRENHLKIFKLHILRPRSAHTENFIKSKRLGTPKLCWADQI